jgi:hypothetical protein
MEGLNLSKIEDDLSFSKMEDDLNFFKMEDDLNFLEKGRQSKFFGKLKKIKEDLNIPTTPLLNSKPNPPILGLCTAQLRVLSVFFSLSGIQYLNQTN